jgi:hypothetical protein
MVGGKREVFGIYDSHSRADHAVDILTKSEFPISEVSVLVPGPLGSKAAKTERSIHAHKRAAKHAEPGAALDGTLGLLTGFAVLSIPGVGPILAAGPLVAALKGFRPDGADGEFSDALILHGIQEVIAKRYEGRLQEGNVLLSIHCDTPEEITQAKELMERAGGEDVTSTGELSADSARPVYRTVSGSHR